MGMCASKNRSKHAWSNDPSLLIQKMKLLQREINAILKQREEESEVYERELLVFAYREAEWKKESKKLREEVKRLRRSLEDREERIKQMEEKVGMVGNNENFQMCCDSVDISSSTAATSLLLVEHLRVERARRDEAVEKWKMLYLAIKHELDDLIKRTHEGTLYWRVEEEDFMEDVQREMKAKDETIQVLKAQIASMEDEEYKRKREIDILRQSLRIMTNSNRATSSPHVKSFPKPSICFSKGLSQSLHL